MLVCLRQRNVYSIFLAETNELTCPEMKMSIIHVIQTYPGCYYTSKKRGLANSIGVNKENRISWFHFPWCKQT